MPRIRAIETQYRGYLFRSRLEARWALYFDMLGMPWLYELEGFAIDGVHYLPDFRLPVLGIWAEVKPTMFTEVAWQKAAAITSVCLDGMPDIRPYCLAEPCDLTDASAYGAYCAGYQIYAENHPRPCEPSASWIYLEDSLCKRRPWRDYGEFPEYYQASARNVAAVNAARRARFER